MGRKMKRYDGSGALSVSWRTNTSTVEAVELANLLKALRKVAGHLGPAAGYVDYAGMTASGGKSILIDPSLVAGEYPVPPEKVDRLVGYVVHEAIEGIEWTGRVWTLLEPDFAAMDGMTELRFQKLVRAAEDIYLDMILKDSVLGRYLAESRRYGPEETARLRSLYRAGPSMEALLHLWRTLSLGEQVVPLLDSRYRETLHLLMMLTSRLMSVGRDQSGVICRCSMRATYYRESWKQLGSKVSWLPLMDKRLLWVAPHPTRPQRSRSPAPQTAENGKVLTPSLAREIETCLAMSSSDITPLIRSAVGYDNPEVVPTSRWDYNIPAHPMIDHKMAGRIGAIFASYADRETLMSRGLTSGRIDERRIHRAPVTGRCFMDREVRPARDWCVTLLIDASGSMRGARWKMVENTVSTIHTALAGYGCSLAAYAYFETDGICMVSSIIRGDKVYSVPPGGRTASGQAIIAASLFMPANRRRKLIIHVTDGESNLGCRVEDGLAFCRRSGIQIVTLGCGCLDRKAMAAQYGSTVEFIGCFGQLPQAMENLLKRVFLYGPGIILRKEQRSNGGNAEERGG